MATRRKTTTMTRLAHTIMINTWPTGIWMSFGFIIYAAFDTTETTNGWSSTIIVMTGSAYVLTYSIASVWHRNHSCPLCASEHGHDAIRHAMRYPAAFAAMTRPWQRSWRIFPVLTIILISELALLWSPWPRLGGAVGMLTSILFFYSPMYTEYWTNVLTTQQERKHQ